MIALVGAPALQADAAVIPEGVYAEIGRAHV